MARFVWGTKPSASSLQDSPLGGFKNKISRANSITQRKSFLFCGHWVSGPLWKLGLLDSFEKALKRPWSGWLQGPLTGDTALNLECGLPSAWEKQLGQSQKKKALVRITHKLKADVNTSILTHSCVWYSQFRPGRMPLGGMSGLLWSGSHGSSLKSELSS